MHSRFTMLPPKNVQRISRSKVPWSYLLVVGRAMMFSLMITTIVLTTAPIINGLPLILLVSHKPVIHVFRCCCFWVEILRYKSQGSGVVGLGGSGGLFVVHLLQQATCRDSLPCIYVQGSNLSSCCGCHYIAYNHGKHIPHYLT